MKNIKSNLFALTITLSLVACGGGDSGSSSTPAPYVAPATYGAIAANIWNQGSTYVGYNGSQLIYGRASQSQADADAIKGCQSIATTTNCKVVLQFGENQCGAIARSYSGSTGIYGTGVASSGAVAEAIAMTDCKNNGGINCVIPVPGGFRYSACNGTGVPTAASVLPNGFSAPPLNNEMMPADTIDLSETK
jgi:hypothetical protein